MSEREVMSRHASVSKQTSKVDLKTTFFTWTIENFSFQELQSRRKKLESKKFCNSSTKSEWSVLFSPRVRICKVLKTDGIAFHLKLCNEKASVTAKFKFEIRDSNDLTLYETEFFAKHFSESKNSWRKRIYGARRNLHEYLFDDTLKLHVEIKEMVDNSFLCYITDDSSVETLGRNFSCMLKNNKFSDLVIKVDDYDFNVHRVILAASSPVFSAMLEYQTQEQYTKTIVVTDLDVQSVSHMLQFIYDGKCPDFKNMKMKQCLGLLKAADKYALRDLIQLIASHLLSIVNCDNVLGIILIADIYQMNKVKQKCLDFIQNEDSANMALGNMDILAEKPELMKEIILRLV